jgi:fructokinase
MLLSEGIDLCVVTLGPQGSVFRVAEGGDYVPAFDVETVDATGCGDAYVAGLLCRLISAPSGWRSQLTVNRMRYIVRYASAVAALTARTLGVIPALPTAAQVDAFLGQRE